LIPQVDSDGIAASQTPAGGGLQNLLLNGALILNGFANLNHGHIIEISSTADDSGRTFTIIGTDFARLPISEVITPGPNTGSVESAKYFKTVTQITIDDNSAGAITVGVNGKSASQIIPLDHFNAPFNVSLVITKTGTNTFTVQHTFDQLRNIENLDDIVFFPNDDPALVDSAVNVAGNYAFHVSGCRLIIPTYTDGEIDFNVTQTGGWH